jgi:predicted nicotinamide N-methyase
MGFGVRDGRRAGVTADPERFLEEHTRLAPVPLVPELRLHLADAAVPVWQATEKALAAGDLPPPFWAFAWVGGQALARYVFDRPECVAGKRVLDLASGSGIVAIAAMKAGAASAIAADIDPFAQAAIRANAAANGVEVTVCAKNLLGSELQDVDVVLVGDFFYDRALADRATAWLAGLSASGIAVLVGDPGRAYLPKEQLGFVAAYDVPTSLEIEDGEVKRSTVYRFQ